MLLKDYDHVYCLIVDDRYELHAKRIKKMLFDQDIPSHKITLFVTGQGQLYPKEFYTQIVTKEDVPSSWTDTPGAYSNFSAFRRIFREALSDKINNLLLMEDDCFLKPEFNEVLDKVQHQLKRLPPWDCLYYGADHRWANNKELSENILRCHKSFQFHCVGLTEKIIVKLANAKPDIPMDCHVAYGLQEKYRAYAIWPHIAVQLPGWSCISEENKDFAGLYDLKGTNSEIRKS